jgi:hypothetical protein
MSPQAPPRTPLVLLGLLSVATFAGPFLILLVIRGGARRDWPPDRPVEWVVFSAVCAAVVLLMAACLIAGLWARPGKGGRSSN